MAETSELTVFRQLLQWRSAGRHAALVTVVHTWGSSPRPPGALLAFDEDGVVVGSVSGGCVEEDLLRAQLFTNGSCAWGQLPAPRLLTYGLDAAQAHHIGLPCGGTLQLLLEPDPEPRLLAQVVGHLQQGHLIERLVPLSGADVQVRQVPRPGALHFDGEQLRMPLGPAWRMLLIGAGDIAAYVAAMAQINGFHITACDPRPGRLHTMAATGVACTTAMPDDAVLQFRPDGRTAVVALAHDPKLDDLALLEALRSDAFYVGAIGSRRNAARRRQRMIEQLGVAPRMLEHLHSPIGLPIGSKTPAEIAVAIVAEVLAVRSRLDRPPQPERPQQVQLPAVLAAQAPSQPARESAIDGTYTVIDARGTACPVPILRAKRALNDLRAGERLLVLATDDRAAQDFHAFAAQTGHTVTEYYANAAGVHHIFLAKAMRPRALAKTPASGATLDAAPSGLVGLDLR
ncbi:XdhC family protein [Lampropedia cohaerens]|uniref:XdhC family protein n=1 Tax=Lampropedia cohaerens TaxID=1610491 RepID=UPI000A07D0EA|nr:XdhC family protein [Lampropedia cohaerens]